jgi:predicted phage terminase large subunit-like protein
MRRLSLLRFTKDATPDYRAGKFHAKLASILEGISQDTANGISRRVMLFAPPRHGKSRMTSVCWPPWHLGHYPGHEILSASYAKSLATKHSAEARALLAEDWYRESFPNTRFDPSSKAKDDWRVVDVGVDEQGRATLAPRPSAVLPQEKKASARTNGGDVGPPLPYNPLDPPQPPSPTDPAVAHPSPKGAPSTRTTARKRGGYKAIGVGSGATGRGARIAIIDDPFKDKLEAYSARQREKVWDWYNWVLSTRLAPGGSVVLVMTRWHKDDLAGRLLERDGEKGKTLAQDGSEGKWEVIRFPAIAEEDEEFRKAGEALFPEFYPADCALFQDMRKDRAAWNALYRQHPSSEEGNLFRREWWRYYSRANLPHTFDRVVISVDGNAKKTTDGSFACIQVWGKLGSAFYLLDQKRGRWSYPRLREEIRRARHACPYAPMLIEDKASGQNAIEELQQELGGITAIMPKGDKAARASMYADRVQCGAIYLPDPQEVPWVKDFVEEMADFPGSKHNDQVDCFSQAMGHWPDFVYRTGDSSDASEPFDTWGALVHGDEDDQDPHGADLGQIQEAEEDVDWLKLY